MSESTDPSRSESTRNLLDDWHLSGSTSGQTPLPCDPSKETPSPSGTEPTGELREGAAAPSGQPSMVIPNFTIHRAASEGARLRSVPTEARIQNPRGQANGVIDSAVPFLRPGTVLAGFRILTELGRGAFATVFLAEQADLANRQVALKVSQPVGDEPQILARLQHTHIVPIHSVHDDPGTGLRLLCMPYLGGANLAEVLETAGARLPSHVTGFSLVEALDLIGNKLAPSELPRPRVQTGQISALESAESVTRYAGAATAGIGSPSQVRSIWGRYWARLPWWNRFETGPVPTVLDSDGELGQPARRFLRNASYIQAAVWIIARLAEALDHAHSRGLLHRDLKPSNILIAADGTPMLLDFNLSADAAAPIPDGGAKVMLGGTLPYMAPEHLDAFNPLGSTPPSAVDERSDLYALGVILTEMLVGHHPFSDPPPHCRFTDVLTFMTQERRRGAPSVRASNPLVPWSLDALLKKCLQPDPNLRYPRARDLAEDLRRYLDDLPLKHTPEPSARECAAKWARRNPRVTSSTSIALLATVLIFGLGGVIWFVADHLQSASARLHRSTFQRAFDESQLLLNTTSGPPEHLGSGIARAQQALDAYGIGRSDDWTAGELVRRLPAAEQRELREQAAEIVLLLARARVFLAERTSDEAGRARALEWAVSWLDLAEAFDPYPSAALYDDRAHYRAALGLAGEAAHDRALRARTPPRTSRDFYLLGTSALAHRQTDEAEPALLRAVALDPRRFWSWFSLGLCHADQGRFLEAAGDFNVCTALVPAFAWPHLNRGLVLARLGRLTDARAAYNRALQANPHFIEALFNRGLVCLELNDLAQAEKDFDQARALGQRDPALRAALAEAKARLGHRAQARIDYDALVDSNPDDATLLVARGFFSLGDPSSSAQAAAETDFTHALELAPKLARAHLGLAHIRRRSDLSTALLEVNEALDADPNLVDAIEFRALVLARLGDPSTRDDVDRLLQSPTPHRLYNAACALAILSNTDNDSELINRAADLLRRAIAAGFPPEQAVVDPDLLPLRNREEFKKIEMEKGSKNNIQ
jgi:eukaryotic-like serine/threonine-protein kinase